MAIPAIGIDLGATYSCVGVFVPDGKYGKVEIISNDLDKRITPSYVAFNDTERLIGDAARDQFGVNPTNTIFDVKRLIGRRFQDPSVQDDMNHWPFNLHNDDDRPKIAVKYKSETRSFCAEEISSMVLTKMKETAEAYLGRSVTNAVISVPACFNASQRQATKDAGTIAGLNVLRIINEPTAAAIAYSLQKNILDKKNILIFDLGGGTLDVSIMTITNRTINVRSTAGNNHLGGEDFDERLVNHFVQEFERKHNIDLSDNRSALHRLRTACERAKLALSRAMQASIKVDYLCEGIDFHSQITRTTFEEICADLFSSTLEPVEKCLRDAKLDKFDIDEIVLVGGSTRIPKIEKLLGEYFEGRELNKTLNREEAVAYGAAVQAAILSEEKSEVIRDLVFQDIAPFPFGIETENGLMSVMVDRNTFIPKRWTKKYTTSVDNQTSLLIEVYEGEHPMNKDNHLFGKFNLCNICPAPRGVPKIVVTFNLDTNGILDVSAEEKSTGTQNGITITSEKNDLSKMEIDRMIRETKYYHEEDEKQREWLTAHNDLEEYAFSVKSSIEEERDRSKFSEEHRQKIIEKVDNVLKLLDDKSLVEKEEFEHQRKELESIWNPTTLHSQEEPVHTGVRFVEQSENPESHSGEQSENPESHSGEQSENPESHSCEQSKSSENHSEEKSMELENHSGKQSKDKESSPGKKSKNMCTLL